MTRQTIFTQSANDLHLRCFYFVAITNNAPLYTNKHVLVHTCLYFCWVHTQEWNCSSRIRTGSTMVDTASFSKRLCLFALSPAEMRVISSHWELTRQQTF